MTELKQFWQVNNAVLVALYMIAAVLVIDGRTDHWGVILVAVILVAHVLEIPLAMKMLKEKNPSIGRLVVGTVLFGFTWWVPAKKGIYKV